MIENGNEKVQLNSIQAFFSYKIAPKQLLKQNFLFLRKITTTHQGNKSDFFNMSNPEFKKISPNVLFPFLKAIGHEFIG